MSYSLPQGVCRGRQLTITLEGPATVEPTLVRFWFERGGARIGSIERVWPSDFEFSDEQVPQAGRIALDGYEEFVPFTNVVATLGDAPVVVGPNWQLSRLFATTEEEFSRNFFRRKNRTNDRETQLFAASQIRDHYHLSKSHRAVAAVIYAYRAMDLADAASCAAAIRWLLEELTTAHEIDENPHPRLDGSHLTVSMGFALWQLYLYTNQHLLFIGQLDRIIAYLQVKADPFPGVIMNGCMTVLLRTYLYALEGKTEKVSELATFNADLYLNNLPRLARHAIWFKEMVLPHNAVALSMDIDERAQASKKSVAADVVITAAHRLNQSEAAEVLSANFRRLCRALSRQRRNAMEAAEG